MFFFLLNQFDSRWFSFIFWLLWNMSKSEAHTRWMFIFSVLISKEKQRKERSAKRLKFLTKITIKFSCYSFYQYVYFARKVSHFLNFFFPLFLFYFSLLKSHWIFLQLLCYLKLKCLQLKLLHRSQIHDKLQCKWILFITGAVHKHTRMCQCPGSLTSWKQSIIQIQIYITFRHWQFTCSICENHYFHMTLNFREKLNLHQLETDRQKPDFVNLYTWNSLKCFTSFQFNNTI